ncbi:MAG: glycosyltransferase family 2 protein [Bacteroidales bacterium]|nr:glycosyltransferase family 2 protein [Bacteroidales bacterium]
MRTAVVILNWNGKNFLEKFLPGLVESLQDEDRAEVVVADNASTDGSVRFLQENFPDVKLIVLDKNYGFTGGYNRAFKILSQDYDPEFFVLINSDIEVGKDWLYPLVEWMEMHPECGACAPKLLGYQDKTSFEYAGAAGGFLDKYGYPLCRGRVMGRVEKDLGQYDTPQQVMWATGACLLTRSSLWKNNAGLDESFFAHMEEIDFCWRAALKGHSVCVVPRSVVYHVGGGTLPQGSPRKLYLNYRNNLLMLRKNLPKTLALKSLYGMLSIVADPGARFNDDVMCCHQAADELEEDLLKDIVEECADLGISRAKWRIFVRMVLDGASAAVYLISFKWDYFKAVLNAHKDYKALARGFDANETRLFLQKEIQKRGAIARTMLDVDITQSRSEMVQLRGILPVWMIPNAVLRGAKVFEWLRDYTER